MGTKDQYAVYVSIDDIPIVDSFDTFSGGDLDSSEVKYKPGAMGAEETLGGSATISNVIVGRHCKASRGDHELIDRLYSRVGKAKMTVTRQQLDPDGHAFGKPKVFRGKLKKVTLGEFDSNGNGADIFSLEQSTEGKPG